MCWVINNAIFATIPPDTWLLQICIKTVSKTLAENDFMCSLPAVNFRKTLV